MNERQEKLLETARKLLGTPYKYAAAAEDIPKYLDCSSFTQYAYKQIGIEIPRSTVLQAAYNRKKTEQPTDNSRQEATDLEPGDLLFFRGSKGHYDDELFPDEEIYIGHVAMYTENNNAIHATSRKGGVIEKRIEEIIKNCGPIVIIKRIL